MSPPELQQAQRHLQAGRLAEAAGLCEQRLQQAPGDIDALHLLAMVYGAAGDGARAEGLLRRCLTLRPADPQLWNSLGRIGVQLGHAERAVDAFREAVRLAPGSAAYQNDLGTCLARAERYAEAAEAFRASLAIEPDERVATGNLAMALERTSALDEAAAVLENGLSRRPGEPTLELVAARVERRRGDVEGARRRLEALNASDLPPPLARDVHYELGRVCDDADDVAAAYAHFEQANALARRIVTPQIAGVQSLAAEAAELHASVTREWLAGWQEVQVAADAEQPVFLIGFPRSGTTLLDTLLGGHEAVTVLEERPTVQAMLNAASAAPPGFPQAFVEPSPAAVDHWRGVYRQVAQREGAAQIGVTIDKSPLNTLYAGFIHRVFPGARFVMVFRHPYDVCLSCYMHEFGNPYINASFCTLQDTIQAYTQVMDLWRRYREALPLTVHEIRYEDYVSDVEREVGALLAFLGLQWSERCRDHVAHARGRAARAVPGYAQIGQPIHRRSLGRWRRYRTQLGEALEGLTPYAEWLGYPTDGGGGSG